MDSMGSALLNSLEESSHRVGALQEQVLAQILALNVSNSEYLIRHGLSQPNIQAFKQCLPLITYQDISKDISRIAHGDRSAILCARQITEFFKSSGTSGGRHKLFPRVEGDYIIAQSFFDLVAAILNKHLPGLKNGKAMYFMYVRQPDKTPGGLIAWPALTGYYNSPEFKNSKAATMLTSPLEVILCTDVAQALYCHLLCGLIQSSDVVKMGAFFASAFVKAIRSLEHCWKDLAEDIRSGTLNDRISNPIVRQAVQKILKPNPGLADAISRECSRASWKGIIRRLWPNLKVIDTSVTGSMQQYVSNINYLSDQMQIASTMYASSECYMGVNINPLCPVENISYMLVPSSAYYEFLKVTRNAEDSCSLADPVDLTNVELGEEYELVITTHAGLYRYRMGDILKVIGFYNDAPLFSFICRSGIILSIDSDKTDEKELQFSIDSALKVINDKDIHLLDYSSYADLSSNPPHYVIFWELNANLDQSQLEECCHVMESCLNVVYKRGRSETSIGPLEIRLVKLGTFDKVAECAASKGGSVAQFKQPRCIKDVEMLDILVDGVYQRAWSPAPPHYP